MQNMGSLGLSRRTYEVEFNESFSFTARSGVGCVVVAGVMSGHVPGCGI